MKAKVLTDFQICVGVPFMLLRVRAEYCGGALVFLWGGAMRRGGSVSIFWGSFAGVGGVIVCFGVGAGHWVILPWGFGIIPIFPNFRGS